ncbi:hypothetical protein [Burkholderia ubonensis]|uniref:hypothetical protein n=1 Tax=Burkholderia ubonensis TaxID=101571 RepID=UPI000A97622D|nr:hypothetical protein [Burkholderia ubonensis]
MDLFFETAPPSCDNNLHFWRKNFDCLNDIADYYLLSAVIAILLILYFWGSGIGNARRELSVKVIVRLLLVYSRENPLSRQHGQAIKLATWVTCDYETRHRDRVAKQLTIVFATPVRWQL